MSSRSVDWTQRSSGNMSSWSQLWSQMNLRNKVTNRTSQISKSTWTYSCGNNRQQHWQVGSRTIWLSMYRAKTHNSTHVIFNFKHTLEIVYFLINAVQNCYFLSGYSLERRKSKKLVNRRYAWFVTILSSEVLWRWNSKDSTAEV